MIEYFRLSINTNCTKTDLIMPIKSHKYDIFRKLWLLSESQHHRRGATMTLGGGLGGLCYIGVGGISTVGRGELSFVELGTLSPVGVGGVCSVEVGGLFSAALGGLFSMRPRGLRQNPWIVSPITFPCFPFILRLYTLRSMTPHAIVNSPVPPTIAHWPSSLTFTPITSSVHPLNLSTSNTMVKELCQLPAKICRPCARATSFASGPTPSYIGQLLTAVEPNPVVASLGMIVDWYGFGPE